MITKQDIDNAMRWEPSLGCASRVRDLSVVPRCVREILLDDPCDVDSTFIGQV